MSTDPATPPSLPSPVPPRRAATGTSNRTAMWIVLLAVGALAVIFVGGFGAAILIPTVSKVRETARRTVDNHSLRQIAQAALIYAADKGGRLPGQATAPDGTAEADDKLTTIHAVAVALARDGGLNEASLWFSASDKAAHRAGAPTEPFPIVLEDGTASPEFMAQPVLSWDFVTGLHVNHGPNTPVAWTRGLRRDGRWDPATGVNSSDGGHIAFLGGHVTCYPTLEYAPLLTPEGLPTSDIIQALPPGTRVVGAGPGTLHGAAGGSR